MIDIAALPSSNVFRVPEFEDVLAENLAELKKLKPDYQPLESDDYMLLIQAFSYRELHLYQRLNQRLKATLLLTAKDKALDAKAVDYGVVRLENESDEAFLQRILDSLLRYSYEHHAKSVSSDIDDAHEVSPQKGVVHVYVASFKSALDAQIIEAVKNKLLDPKIRHVTDDLKVFESVPKKITLVIQVELIEMAKRETVEPLIRQNFAKPFNIMDGLTPYQIATKCNIAGVHNAKATSHTAAIVPALGERLVIDSLILNFKKAVI